jgi:hypothetical protein
MAKPSTGNRIGMAVALAFVALILHTFYQVYQDRRARERSEALLADARAYQDEVAAALQARKPMPTAAKLPRHASAIAAEPDGSIAIDVADEHLANGRITLRPVANAKGEVMWTCSAQGIRPALLPARCRP